MYLIYTLKSWKSLIGKELTKSWETRSEKFDSRNERMMRNSINNGALRGECRMEKTTMFCWLYKCSILIGEVLWPILVVLRKKLLYIRCRNDIVKSLNVWFGRKGISFFLLLDISLTNGKWWGNLRFQTLLPPSLILPNLAFLSLSCWLLRERMERSKHRRNFWLWRR